MPLTNARERITRRRFLESSALAVGALHLLPARALSAPGRPGANSRFVVAHIGVGGMGMTHLANMLRFQKEGKVRIAAVCDVDDNRLEAAVENAGPGVIPYRDYRYILERNDIDAVLIATPDHWHAVQTVHACQSGKHVYVEKPASVTVREGQAMVAAARANKVAVQVGAQARTAKGAWYTCRAIRNGIVGKVTRVSCWHYANPVDEQPVADSAPPEGLPAGELSLVPGGRRRPDPRPGRPPVQHDSVVHECRPPNILHGRGRRQASRQRTVGLPGGDEGGLPVQEPGLDIGVGTAGQQSRPD